MTIHPHAWRNLMKSRAVHHQVGGFRILGHLNIICGAPVRIWGLAWMESITYWTACRQEPNVLLKWSVGSWNRFLKLTVSLWRDAASSVQTPARRSRCWLFDHVAGDTETLRRVRQDGFAAAPARRKFILAPSKGRFKWNMTPRRGFDRLVEGDPVDRRDAEDVMDSTLSFRGIPPCPAGCRHITLPYNRRLW